MVAFVTLMALGQLYDPQQPLTILIAFVGAVYVMVRGFTNVGEAMDAASKRRQEGTNQER
jgi:arginine exporter protein ArgO